MYTDKLAVIVKKYNNACHSRIKMKPADVNSSTHIYFNKENNQEDAIFEVGDHVRISKYKNILTKGYTPNCSEEVLRVKKVNNTVPWTFVISDISGEEIVGRF